MAASTLWAREVSELCLGKPALRSLPAASATVGDALAALKRSGEAYVGVWTCGDHVGDPADEEEEEECRCIGKVCLADVVCFLAKEEKLRDPLGALQEPVSRVLPPKDSGLVRHLDPDASLLEAIDLILEGAQNLVIPIRTTRKKQIQRPPSNSTLHNNNRLYCWLTPEDIIRYLLNCISLFSSVSSQSIESLGIIDADAVMAVHYDDPASFALPLLSECLLKQTSVAVLDLEGRLIGEISPSTLHSSDETLPAAIATLSIADLMAYIDCGEPPEALIQLVKERLEERNFHTALELTEDESGISCSSSTCSSYSSSDDDEFSRARSGRLSRSSKKATKSTEAIVCYPWNSLIAVMIQAISHRLSCMWVVEEDGSLVGLVTYVGMLKVFRERLKSTMQVLQMEHP